MLADAAVFAKLFNVENEIAIFLDVLTQGFLSPDPNEKSIYDISYGENYSIEAEGLLLHSFFIILCVIYLAHEDLPSSASLVYLCSVRIETLSIPQTRNQILKHLGLANK